MSRFSAGSRKREPDLTNIARVTAALGLPALESSWQRAIGHPLPSHVRAYVEEHLAAAEPQSP